MKFVVSMVLILMLFAAAGASASENFVLYPSDMDIVSQNEVEPRTAFAESPLKSFKTNIKCLKFLEYFGKVEYGVESNPCSFQLGLWQNKPSIVTRIQLFDKPIYLTFTISQ